jgi:uncharacterized membrane protein YcfT
MISTDKQRVDFLDILKGIAILLVVMQHVSAVYDKGIGLLVKFDISIWERYNSMDTIFYKKA